MHARLRPKQHRFNYRIFSLVLDIDRYEEAETASRFFSVNRKNLVAFHEKHHGPKDGTSLRKHIDRLLVKGGMQRPAKILFWCNPSVLGYTFNPLSIYFCYDNEDNVTALVYQVHNTFGENHSYIASNSDTQNKGASIRQTAEKRFYVSPFLDMNLRYNFRINPPAGMLKVRILEHDDQGPILSAAFSGKKAVFSTQNLLLGILQTAGLTWKIIAGIHYEAMILWLKGVKLRQRPHAPKRASYVQRNENTVAGKRGRIGNGTVRNHT